MGEDNFFEMSKESLQKVRFIHLEKKACHGESDNDKKCKEEKEPNKIIFPNDVIGFYSFGFFDSVKCIRPSNSSCLFNFKHHFAVSYPYNRNMNIKKVEQWFGLIPLNKKYQWGRLNKNLCNDIFFYYDLSKQNDITIKMPFVGIILISLNCYEKGKEIVKFDDALKKYADEINSNITSNFNFKNFIGRLYITLNCADLCMVVRTSDIKDIHAANLLIQEVAVKIQYQVNTTVMFMAQVSGIKNFNKVYNSNTKRKDIMFIVRSNMKYNLVNSKSSSYGVNGNGRFVTCLSYDQYMKMFFEQCKHCVGEMLVEGANGVQIKDSEKEYVKSICHERQWFQDQYLIDQADEIKDFTPQYRQTASEGYQQLRDMIIDVENAAKTNLNFYYYSTFDGYRRLVQELLDTYSDLWYQSTSPNGYIFYSQLYIALSGIKDLMESVKKENENEVKMEKCRGIVNILQNLVGDINGYNKQMQFLNQDSVYYPSYEIQSKVNAEKYIMAYCSFLHLIFAKYYYENNTKGQSKYTDDSDVSYQSFPIAFLDIDSMDIETTFYFAPKIQPKLTCSQKKEKRKLVAVHFPSYSYFADVWTVVPLLIHEICHSHHYGEIADRNNAIIDYIRGVMSQFLAQKMIYVSNNGFVANGITLLEELLEHIISDSISDMWKKSFDLTKTHYKVEKIRMNQLEYVINVFYANIFSSRNNSIDKVSYSEINQLKEKAKEKFKDILMLLNFKVLPLYVNGNKISFDEKIVKCWLSALSCVINNIKDRNNNCSETDEIIKNIDWYLKEDDSHNEFYSELKEITKDFIEIYWMTGRNDSSGDVNKYRDSNFKSSQKMLWIGSGILAKKYAHSIADKLEGIIKKNGKVNKIEVKDIENQIYNYMIQNLTYNIINPIEQYYKKVTESLNGICNKYKIRDESKDQLEYIKTQCVSEYISFTNSVYYIMEYFDNTISPDTRNLIVDDDISEFTKILYFNGHKKIDNIMKNPSERLNVANIFEKASRENLMSLGFLNDDDKIINELIIKTVSCISKDDLKDFLKDKLGIYKEIFADCGMCSAMGFSAFGYMMFCSYIYFNMSKKSDLAFDQSNSLIERIKEIAYTFFGDDNQNLEKNDFRKKFFNFEMMDDIANFISTTYTRTPTEKIKKVIKNFKDYRLKSTSDIFNIAFKSDILYWNFSVIKPLLEMLKKSLRKAPDNYQVVVKNNKAEYRCEQIAAYACSYLECIGYLAEILYEGNVLYSSSQKSLFGRYFFDLRKHMMNSEWVKCIQKQDITKEIGEYYNGDIKKKHNMTLLESAYENYACGLATHYNFVYKFYCMYRSAYGNVIINSNENDEIYEWFKLLDDYYYNYEKE